MKPDEGRQRLAELAWRRYQTMVTGEGRDQQAAFIEVVKSLLEHQDDAWAERDRALMDANNQRKEKENGE